MDRRNFFRKTISGIAVLATGGVAAATKYEPKLNHNYPKCYTLPFKGKIPEKYVEVDSVQRIKILNSEEWIEVKGWGTIP